MIFTKDERKMLVALLQAHDKGKGSVETPRLIQALGGNDIFCDVLQELNARLGVSIVGDDYYCWLQGDHKAMAAVKAAIGDYSSDRVKPEARCATDYVSQITYTRDEAKAAWDRVDNAVERGDLKVRSASALKAHITRRTVLV